MDPFSAATGVAGLISLGIEVCKGLNAYCRDYRSRDSDILALSQRAKRLEAFLHLIESRMEGSSQVDRSLATIFQDCHTTCNMCLQDFANLKTKYARPKAVFGFRKQSKAFVRQLQFPFHKDQFDGLKFQMQEFQNALSNCLLLLNHDSATESLHTTISEAANVSSAIILQGQRTADQISTLLPQIDRSIDEKLSRFEQLVLARHGSREAKAAHTHIHEQDATNPVDDRHGLSSDNNVFDNGRRPTESSAAGANITIQPYSQRHQQLRRKNSTMLLNFDCNCEYNTPISRPSSRSPDVLEHEEGCPVSFLNKRGQVISGEIRFLGTLFRWKVSIRYSQFFLRDLQVQPNFTATSIVENSPATSLIMSLGQIRGKMTESEVEDKLSAIIGGLHELFMDRKAWPTDISPLDLNLIHESFRWFSYHWPQNTAYLFVQFLRSLVTMGVPINGSGCCGTPLRWLLWFRGLRQPRGIQTLTNAYNKTSSFVAREMMSMDAYYSENPDSELYQQRPFSGTLDMSILFPCFGDVLHCFDYGELSSALIRRSETDVCRLLSQSSDYIFEKGHQGQTPLHVSAGWPLGLNLLFEAAGDACRFIINTAESTGISPINCAIQLHQTESIVILLKHGAAIDLEDTSVYFPSDWIGVARPQTREVCNLLAATLADRRKKLLQYALENLPQYDVVRFDLRNMMMLQHNAFEVIETMKTNGIQLPIFCGNVRRGSIYHSNFMDDTLAEALFEAGFDVVDLCWNGYTPLMICRSSHTLGEAVRLINWFYNKKADFLAIIPVNSGTHSAVCPPESRQFRVIHRLASTLGYLTPSIRHPNFDSSMAYFQYCVLLRKTFSEAPRDPCRCHCAPEGCNPLSLFTKRWFVKPCLEGSPRYFPESSYPFDDLDTILDIISEKQKDIQAAFIRVCTFRALGMRHTCCEHDLWSHDLESLGSLDLSQPLIKLIDPMDAEEIKEEDRYSAEILEELMIEFGSRLQDTRQSFRDFWEWWNKRMDGLDAEKDPISGEDIEVMVDIGIRLEV